MRCAKIACCDRCGEKRCVERIKGRWLCLDCQDLGTGRTVTATKASDVVESHGAPTARLGSRRLIFHPILNPALNNLPLIANRAEIEKVRPFILQVSEEQKAAHHDGIVGCFFTHRSYSLRIAPFAPPFFTLDMQTPSVADHPPNAARTQSGLMWPWPIVRRSIKYFAP